MRSWCYECDKETEWVFTGADVRVFAPLHCSECGIYADYNQPKGDKTVIVDISLVELIRWLQDELRYYEGVLRGDNVMKGYEVSKEELHVIEGRVRQIEKIFERMEKGRDWIG